MKKKVLAIIIWVLTAAVAVTAGVLAFTEECEHKWSDWKVVAEATCEGTGKDGQERRSCSKCDEVEERVVEWKHTPGRKQTTNATCTKKGETVVKCTVCSKVLEREELPMIAHNFKLVSSTEATCTNAGKKIEKCSTCSEEKTTEIPALNHTYGDPVTTEATCALEGKVAKTCGVCGHEEVIETIAKLEHTFDDPVIGQAPTCTLDGKWVKICSECDHEEFVETISKLGHSWENDEDEVGEFVAEKPATCSEAGYKAHKVCVVCETKNEEYEVIKPHYSTLVDVPKNEPADCFTAGHQAGKWCTVCENFIEGGEEIKAGHLLSDEEGAWTITTEATCFSYGEEEQECARCHEVQVRSIGKTPHEYDSTKAETYVAEKSATCYAAGHTAYYTCIHCKTAPNVDEVVNGTKFAVIPMLAHSFNDEIGVCEHCNESPFVLEQIGNTNTYKLVDFIRMQNDLRVEFTIPLNVVEIAEFAFENCDFIQSITLTPDVLKIGKRAFEDCTALRTINLEKVEVIEEEAFNNCRSLKEISLDEVKVLGDYAFKDCSALTKVSIADTAETIGSSIFRSCSALKSVSVPFVGVSADETKPFEYFFGGKSFVPRSLTEITVLNLKDGVVFVSAFANLSTVTTLTFKSDITKIEENAFANCSTLSEIKIETVPTAVKVNNFDGVEFIGALAFDGCGLKQVTLPFLGAKADATDNLTLKYAFGEGTGVKDVTVLEIASGCVAEYAFEGNEALSSVRLPNTVTEIGAHAFAGCIELKSIYIGLEEDAVENTVPVTVTKIGVNSFSNTAFESLTLPFVGNGSDMTNFGYIFGGNENVPAKLKSVTILQASKIEASSFVGCKTIESIVLPETVTEIGAAAFSGCEALKNINYSEENATGVLPASVLVIGDSAFADTAVENLVIPTSVVKMGAGVFSGNESLKNLTVPFVGASLEDRERNNKFAYIFGDTVPASLLTVTVLGGTKLSANAFEGAFMENIIPVIVTLNTIQVIGDGAFINNEKLGTVVANSVTAIEKNAFFGCIALEKAVVAQTLKTVGESAFSGCLSLSALHYNEGTNNNNEETNGLPVGVTEIGAEAFKDTAFKSFVIPASVTALGNGVFAYTTESQLEALTIPFIGNTADKDSDVVFGTFFNGDNTSVPATLAKVDVNGATVIEEKAFADCGNIQEITLSSEVLTKIYGFAFENCVGITEFVVPNNVEFIDGGAFQGCTSIEALTIPFVGQVEAFGSDVAANYLHFGYIFGTGSVTGHPTAVPTSLKKVVITKAQEINYKAFDSCLTIEEVFLPSTLKKLGDYAFYNCTALKYVHFDSVEGVDWALEEIGSSVFRACKNLIGSGKDEVAEEEKPFTVPASVRKIGYFAFNGCSSLCGIVTEGSNSLNNISFIAQNAFQGAFATTASLKMVNVEKIVAWAFLGCNLKSLEIDNTSLAVLDEVGKESFKNCENLESVVIKSDKLEKIEGTTFGYCDNLKSVVIPQSVKTIEMDAFRECASLLYVVNDVNKVGYDEQGNVVCDVEKLSVDIPNVEMIDGYAFADCTSLFGPLVYETSVSVGTNAFAGCTGLTEIVFNYSAEENKIGYTSIGVNAFKNCTNVQTIYLSYNGDRSFGEDVIGSLGLGVHTVKSSIFENCGATDSLRVYVCLKFGDDMNAVANNWDRNWITGANLPLNGEPIEVASYAEYLEKKANA